MGKLLPFIPPRLHNYLRELMRPYILLRDWKADLKSGRVPKDMVRDAGYRAAVSKVGVGISKKNFYELRRLPTHQQYSLAKFARIIEGAYDWWYNWLIPLAESARAFISRGRR